MFGGVPCTGLRTHDPKRGPRMKIGPKSQADAERRLKHLLLHLYEEPIPLRGRAASSRDLGRRWKDVDVTERKGEDHDPARRERGEVSYRAMGQDYQARIEPGSCRPTRR